MVWQNTLILSWTIPLLQGMNDRTMKLQRRLVKGVCIGAFISFTAIGILLCVRSAHQVCKGIKIYNFGVYIDDNIQNLNTPN